MIYEVIIMAAEVDILEKNKRIDVICQHCCSGKIYPIRMRIVDEDGQRQEFTVKEFIDKTIYSDYNLPNGIKVARAGIWKFECKILVFGHFKWITIIYNSKENIWRLQSA